MNRLRALWCRWVGHDMREHVWSDDDWGAPGLIVEVPTERLIRHRYVAWSRHPIMELATRYCHRCHWVPWDDVRGLAVRVWCPNADAWRRVP